MIRLISTLLFLILPVSVFATDKALIEKTADHICSICSNKSKSRIAVYNFTDQNDTETKDTKRYTTKIISVILECKNLRVIDPSRVESVMEEQSKGLLGIVDDETAPEAGKLLGADALLFGQVDSNIIQVRLIDASTGEILGATVEESDSGKDVEVKVEKFDDEASKQEFRKSQLRKQLDFLFRNRPGVFLFMTSTDEETAALEKKYPSRFNTISRLLNRAPDDKKEKFNKTRNIVLDIRKKDPEFNKKILRGHNSVISGSGRRRRR